MGKTILPDPRITPRVAGICTFGRFPRLADVPKEHLPLDWAVYGVPYDAGVTYRPGARFGPRAIRDESQYLKPHHVVHDVTVTEELSIADAGDAPINPYSPEQNTRTVAEFAADLPTPEHTKLLALGGDHSIALSNMRATHQRLGGGPPMALIHFDSHLDTVDAVLGERYSHASPFIRAVEEALIDPSAMLSVGIKGPLNTRGDLAYTRDLGAQIVTYDDWARARGQMRIDSFVESLVGRNVYITFDIDCVDPAYAPGTGTPSVGGFTSAEVLGILRSLKGVRVVGADVVEVLPDRDHAGITSLLAAHVALEILALDAAGSV